VRAVFADADGERGRRTHFVPAVVEREQVVEEVVRAVLWEASMKKSPISVLLQTGARSQRPDVRVESVGRTAGHVDDDRALHREAKRDDSAAEMRDASRTDTPVQCACVRNDQM